LKWNDISSPLGYGDRSSFRDQVMRRQNWPWRVLGGLSLILASLTTVVLVVDYRKTIALRDHVGKISIGASESEILNLIGSPDSVSTGSRSDPLTGEMVDGYSVWKYCSRFDWDGQRSRWNDSSFLPYWMSRINPTIDNNHDAVIELWIRSGQLQSIENSVIDNLLGRNPTLSL
jgi:hypothetical protein